MSDLKKYYKDQELIYIASAKERVHWVNDKHIHAYVSLRKNIPEIMYEGSETYIVENSTDYAEYFRDEQEKPIWNYLSRVSKQITEAYITLCVMELFISSSRPKPISISE